MDWTVAWDEDGYIHAFNPDTYAVSCDYDLGDVFVVFGEPGHYYPNADGLLSEDLPKCVPCEEWLEKYGIDPPIILTEEEDLLQEVI